MLNAHTCFVNNVVYLLGTLVLLLDDVLPLLVMS